MEVVLRLSIQSTRRLPVLGGVVVSSRYRTVVSRGVAGSNLIPRLQAGLMANPNRNDPD